MRDVIVAANWKMHTTPAEAGELARTIAAGPASPGVTRVICPPFVSLAAVGDALAETDPDVGVGAQNVHHELQGAYTGEVSAPMLAGLATWVIVGHSERRRDAGETDELIGRKLGRAIEAGLRPILCVGEQLAEREAGRAGRRRPPPAARRARRPRPGGARGRRAGHRLRTGLGDRHRPHRERRGRRGDGRRDPRDARPSSGFRGGGEDVPVLYGGSVTSATIDEFMAEPSIDGALVGGASLKPDEMAGIVARAGLTAARPRRGRGDRGRTADGRRPRPIVLVVLDGFGIGHDPSADAIAAARHADLARPPARLAARRSCARPRTPSACRPARWATPRSAT